MHTKQLKVYTAREESSVGHQQLLL